MGRFGDERLDAEAILDFEAEVGLDFETRIKVFVYDWIVEHAAVPSVDELVEATGRPKEEIREAMLALQDRRLLVLRPESLDIVMAPPFSGVETPFRVRVGDRTFFANCSWDALGVAAAMRGDADVLTTCGQSGEPLKILVRDQAPVPQDVVAHFAVPAAHWWDDIVYT